PPPPPGAVAASNHDGRPMKTAAIDGRRRSILLAGAIRRPASDLPRRSTVTGRGAADHRR
ncbi:MAG: hypothetical protein ACRDD1_13940, partial [Planctomycetia bacterium]